MNRVNLRKSEDYDGEDRENEDGNENARRETEFD